MRSSLILILVLCASAASAVDIIHAYHFHTYFLQRNNVSVSDVRSLRQMITQEIESGDMRDCALNRLNMEPKGPHPIGSFETCCNATSLNSALSFFMREHGKFSVLLHPLTREEVKDHTERAFWMGLRQGLDLGALQPLLSRTPTCPVRYNGILD